MLPVSVKLHRKIIAVLTAVEISRLHCTADAQVDRQVYIIQSMFPANLQCIICGTVIDNNIVKSRRMGFDVFDGS